MVIDAMCGLECASLPHLASFFNGSLPSPPRGPIGFSVLNLASTAPLASCCFHRLLFSQISGISRAFMSTRDCRKWTLPIP